jgi:crotonobetainyl-CoA:carnitine CoA-transferase CaiB-like acyl-CoA transferase
VAERLGIGPDALRERNSRLVYARMTGYGQDGPLAGHAGHDINYLALTGALHAIGTAESPLNLVGDYGGGGMLLAVGLLSAILEAHDDADPTAWAAHRAALAARFAEKTRDEWGRLLDTPGCCATLVLSLAEAPQHPHNAARQTFIELDGITQPAPAPRFSRTRPAAPASPSLPGDHTRALLGELGLDTQAIRELEDAGVVAQSEKG